MTAADMFSFNEIYDLSNQPHFKTRLVIDELVHDPRWQSSGRPHPEIVRVRVVQLSPSPAEEGGEPHLRREDVVALFQLGILQLRDWPKGVDAILERHGMTRDDLTPPAPVKV